MNKNSNSDSISRDEVNEMIENALRSLIQVKLDKRLSYNKNI